MVSPSSTAEFDEWNNSQPAALALIMFWLLAGVFLRSLPSSLQHFLPYTVLVLLAGLGFGAIGNFCGGPFGDALALLTSKTPYPGISPYMLQLSVLPPLIVSDMYTTDVQLFIKTLGQTFLLACPGVILQTFLIGACIFYLDTDFTWTFALMFGAMLSCTDPVAVLAGMKELGCDPRLVTIVGAESVLNDACSVVIFMMLYSPVFTGAKMDVVQFTGLNTIGAGALASVFLMVTLAALRVCRKDAPVVVTLMVSMPFLCFYSALLIGTSGILAMVVFGLGLNHFGKRMLSEHLIQESELVWENIEFFANTFAFALSGAIMIASLQAEHVTLADWGMQLMVYFACLAARAISCVFFYPFMNCVGPAFSLKDAVFVWWGGLRGAVGLSVAMMLNMSIPKGDPLEAVGFKFMFYMGGVYILTAVINATTAGPLVTALGLGAKSAIQVPLLAS